MPKLKSFFLLLLITSSLNASNKKAETKDFKLLTAAVISSLATGSLLLINDFCSSSEENLCKIIPPKINTVPFALTVGYLMIGPLYYIFSTQPDKLNKRN